MDWGGQITYLAETTLKQKKVRFGVKDADRLQHLCVVGRQESGRSPLLASMALQDISRGMGTVIIDTSGKLSQLVLERTDDDIKDRLIYLDPADAEFPFSWNPVQEFRALPREEALRELSRALASVYGIPQSILTDCVAEQIYENPTASLLMLHDAVTEEYMRDKYFLLGSASRATFDAALRDRPDDVAFITEHGRYVAKDSLVRNLLGQIEGKFELSKLSDRGVLVIDLSRIRMFPTRVKPLIRIFVHAIRARAKLDAAPLALYLFDCLRYLSEDDVDIMFMEHSIACTLSDTLYNEEDKAIREKTVSRCGSIAAFTPSPVDIAVVEKMFYPYVEPEELSRLETGEFVIALTIDSVRSRPFFAKSLVLPDRKGVSHQDLLVVSRERYTTNRIKVDALFKREVPKEKKGKGKDEDPGSFSDAFRSIFTKRAGGPGDPPKDAAADAVPKAPPAEKKPKEKPTPPAEQAKEIAEDDLKQMLYVDPVTA